jgi:hypothetical protein
MHPSVSFALIVRNEEAKLPACLESIAGIGGEIIVVDTGSTDRTKEVAVGFGAKVFDESWIDDFAAARNECIRHATGEWIFWLDADERVDEGNRDKLRLLFEEIIHEGPRRDTKEEKKNVAYVMKCLCVDQAGGGRHGTVVDHVRLFHRPGNLPTFVEGELPLTGPPVTVPDVSIGAPAGQGGIGFGGVTVTDSFGTQHGFMTQAMFDFYVENGWLPPGLEYPTPWLAYPASSAPLP